MYIYVCICIYICIYIYIHARTYIYTYTHHEDTRMHACVSTKVCPWDSPSSPTVGLPVYIHIYVSIMSTCMFVSASVSVCLYRVVSKDVCRIPPRWRGKCLGNFRLSRKSVDKALLTFSRVYKLSRKSASFWKACSYQDAFRLSRKSLDKARLTLYGVQQLSRKSASFWRACTYHLTLSGVQQLSRKGASF